MGAPGAEPGHPGFVGADGFPAGAVGLVFPTFLAWLGLSSANASAS